MAILLLIPVVLCLICAFKESSVTATFKANKVYGRLSAYLALDFTIVGILALVSVFVPALGEYTGMNGLSGIGMGAVLLALGILIYVHAYIKCPDHLKKKCIPSMIVTAMGVTMKICVFFLPFVWKMSLPDVSDSSEAPEEEKNVEVWKENGLMKEYMKVSNDGKRYYDPDDGEWHRINK